MRGGIEFRERESTFSLRSTAFRPSVLIRARGEVGLRCKGYAWVPVLWSFDNSERYRFSPTCFILWIRVILSGWGCLEAWMTMFSIPKFRLSEEIPSMVVDSFKTVGWTVHVTLCVVVCY